MRIRRHFLITGFSFAAREPRRGCGAQGRSVAEEALPQTTSLPPLVRLRPGEPALSGGRRLWNAQWSPSYALGRRRRESVRMNKRMKRER